LKFLFINSLRSILCGSEKSKSRFLKSGLLCRISSIASLTFKTASLEVAVFVLSIYGSSETKYPLKNSSGSKKSLSVSENLSDGLILCYAAYCRSVS